MSKSIYTFWKTNQKYIASSTFSQKLSAPAYGTQAIGTTTSISSSVFNDDLQRVTGGTTNYAKNTSSLIYTNTTDVTTFTNVELTTAYLSIYEIAPRFNTGTTPLTAWEEGLADEANAASTTYSTYPFEKPFRSQKFCLFFKVLKVHMIELSPGASHKHTSKYNINRVVHGAVANTNMYTKNFTNFRMYIATGTPINDATNKSLVSTSTISIDVVVQRTRTMGSDSRPRTLIYADNALNTITSAQVVSDSVIEADGNA